MYPYVLSSHPLLRVYWLISSWGPSLPRVFSYFPANINVSVSIRSFPEWRNTIIPCNYTVTAKYMCSVSHYRLPYGAIVAPTGIQAWCVLLGSDRDACSHSYWGSYECQQGAAISLCLWTLLPLNISENLPGISLWLPYPYAWQTLLVSTSLGIS